MRRKSELPGVALGVLLIFGVACKAMTNEATGTPTTEPPHTATPTSTATPTALPTATPTLLPTLTATSRPATLRPPTPTSSPPTAESELFNSLTRVETQPPGVAGHLETGALVNDRLLAGSTDRWLFEGQAGRYLTVAARTDEELDLVLTLISPSGVTLATVDQGYSGDTEALFDWQLEERGTYQVVISDFFNSGGRYTISLNQSETPQYGGGGQILVGQTVSGNLQENRDDVWTFDGTAGNVISILLTPEGAQIDLFFELHGPAGERLVALDESYSGDPEILSGFELPLTGTYTIVVNSFSHNGGAYHLALDEGGISATNFHDAGDLSYGETVTETLQTNEVHAWFFAGEAGDEVTLVVTPLDERMDMDVWLLKPDLQRLAMQDEALFGGAETIERTLPMDGEYVIVIREYYGGGGDYRLELEED